MSDFLIGIRDALNIFIVGLLAWCSQGTNRVRVSEPRGEGMYTTFQGAHLVIKSINNYAFPKLFLQIR